ncbi:MAG: helix-turn-helix domain-containing protein [Pseudomonadota bacterium]
MNQLTKQTATKHDKRATKPSILGLSAKADKQDTENALQKVHAADVFNTDCPAHQVIARVGNKWTLLVLYALSRGTMRYTELQQQIGKISSKMLTQVLRNLEKDGLVSRKVYPVVPPMVEYALTPLGASLAAQLAMLCVWAEENYATLSKTWRL